MPPHLSIVSPVFGAPELVSTLVDRIVNAVTPITPDFEIVLVNDDCPGGSWERICQIAEREPRVVGINLSCNVGQHRAITAGVDHARGDWVVVMDCDLQDQPEEIPRLYAKAREGFDTVFGRRSNRQDSRLKILRGDLCIWIYDWLTGLDTDRSIGNFSISNRKVMNAVREYRERDRSFPGIVFRAGFRRATVDVSHAARPSGKTSYTWRRLLRFAMQVLASGTNRPLYASIKFGLLLALGSLVYAVGRLIYHITVDSPVPGWTTLVFLLSFFSGLLFMQLGIIGLYLGKLFDEAKRRPLYHVADITATQAGPPDPADPKAAD